MFSSPVTIEDKRKFISKCKDDEQALVSILSNRFTLSEFKDIKDPATSRTLTRQAKEKLAKEVS